MRPPAARPIALLLTLLLAGGAAAALAQAPPAAAPDAAALADGLWPKHVEANGAVVQIYQPQVDTWEGNRLEARAAVSFRAPGASQPTFGVVWIAARTEVDKAAGLVTLEDIKIPKINFPGTPPAKAQDYLRIARGHAPTGVRTVPLAQLEADLAITRATPAPGVAVSNDPPRIIVSAVPAVLVRIDGQPSLRQTPGSPLLRVINTRALILLDPATGHYDLAARGGWMEAPAVEGPWSAAPTAPAAVEAARRAAAPPQVDLLEAPPSAAASAAAPVVYVSTVPAELIETDGAPAWSPIAGTELLYATNTAAHMFLELKSQFTYLLISGRWFRARTADGPWAYVAPPQLPADFGRIPEQSPAGVVLASVAGTPQAQEAVIANSIPQTATVNRTQARFTATYDGPPQFHPIAGTPLTYAANSPTPIIRVDARTYYALYNGVWFVAVAPSGPWLVATGVPAVIYTIPPASPLRYVTYVRVYGATPAVVYVGYTPGYLGTVVTPDGVVVYGTGVVYTPWVGSVWYPPPPTYGYGAAFAWGATTGFVMGAAVTSAAIWGCCGSTTNVNVNVTKTTYNSSNVYSNSWSKTTVTSGDKSATAYRGPNSAVVTNNQNNNVYASHDGNVYRKEDGQWEKWNGSGNGWQPTQNQPPARSGATTTPAPASSSSQNLGSQRQDGQGGQAARGGQSAPGSARLGGQSAGAGGSPSLGSGSRFSGSQGLDLESMARERGASRFAGRFGGLRR
jgi:hypothetical protein